MLTRKEFTEAQQRAAEMIRKAGIAISKEEEDRIDAADFGLSNLHVEGAQILTLVDTPKISVKVLALFPEQTEPEHWHTATGSYPGKEETVRIMEGTVYFYVPGPDTLKEGYIPEEKEEYYTVRNEVVMKPGDQMTLQPGTKHWFQAGKEGAVMYSFSSCTIDALDPFTDPNIVRVTRIID
jgi:D-lyxose ketol-isomerase